jgi:quinol-cytochrome oxidoreductase complex cytochrome b subunit
MLVVTLMGSTCSLLISTIAIAVGYAIRNKFPELGRYLIGVGRGDFYAHSFYALSALSTTPGPKGHDFLRLRAYGVHPLAAAIAILAIPLLLHMAMSSRPSCGTAPPKEE